MATGGGGQVLSYLDLGIRCCTGNGEVVCVHHCPAHRLDQEAFKDHCLGSSSSNLGFFPRHLSRDFALLRPSPRIMLVKPYWQAAGPFRLTQTYRDSRIDRQWWGQVRFCWCFPHHCTHCDSLHHRDRHGSRSCPRYYSMEYTDEKTSEDPSLRTFVICFFVSFIAWLQTVELCTNVDRASIITMIRIPFVNKFESQTNLPCKRMPDS